jgi:hypothetical protein
MTRRRLTGGIVAGATSLVFAASGSAARADTPQPTCGETLTQSVTLTANLDCGPSVYGAALTIGAAGITVNLNGHAINTVNASGVFDAGFGSVTIEDGGIYSDAGGGIGLANADDVRVDGVGVNTQSGSLAISGGQGDVISDSGFALGRVSVDGADHLQLKDDTFIPQTDQPTITLTDLEASSLIDSTIDDPASVSLTGSDDLIGGNHVGDVELLGGMHDLFEDNTQNQGSNDGLLVAAPVTGAVVRSNLFYAQPFGPKIEGASPLIADNIIDAGSGTGGEVPGMSVSGADARIVANTVNDDLASYGIWVTGAGARIAANTVDHSRGDGLEVAGSGARILANTTDDNGANGIEVTDPTAHINRNTAEDNTLYGVTAAPGDKGKGNIATGNNAGGDQCLNIGCD